jgi:ubiquinone/menaquinone biosynthesis C-methylase UbiE
MNIVSAWTRQIESGHKPSSEDLQDHLAAIHEKNAGFTESVAWKSCDANGKNSYELLADIIDQGCHSNVLDLACGSGVLLDLCNQRFGSKVSFSGIDTSDAELTLARERLAETDIKLHQSRAQELDFIADASVDVILCHWALTLMDPVVPVLVTAKRVLKESGIFAAIIDGNAANAPGYLEVHDIIYAHVQRKYPDYGVIELGDARVRKTEDLQELVEKTFVGSNINIAPVILSFNAAPDLLAREAAGFFYASFVLSTTEHLQMINELENHFSTNMKNGNGSFFMAVNRLIVTKGLGSTTTKTASRTKPPQVPTETARKSPPNVWSLTQPSRL